MNALKTTVGICRLCELTRALVESHIIPRGCYSRLSVDGRSLVNIVRRNAFMSQKQLKVRLLCKACEDKFSKCGERIFFRKCLQRDGSFPLMDEIFAHRSDFVGVRDEVVYCAAANTSIDWEPLAYFAVSLFWRTWAAKHKVQDRISIDLPIHLEASLMSFLLNPGNVIEHAALTINVNERLPELAEDLRYAYSMPQEQGRLPIDDQYLRAYGAECLGFVFTLTTGPEPALTYARSNCILSNPEHPIFISKDMREAMVMRQIAFARASTPNNGLQSFAEKMHPSSRISTV